jgi:hypothetical protein
MYGTYRCRCIVSYRPYGSDRLIVFSEKQIESADVNLKWDPNALTMNTESMVEVSQFVNALTGSSATVVLSDPYMTGVAWAALFDSAAAYTNSSAAAYNHILLPACAEGENASSGKCRPFPTIEDPNLRKGGFGDFAHIVIKLYYEVAGVKFGQDTYFRLQGFNIEHGKTFPKVQLRGVDPQTITFNQSLQNFQLEENKTLEQNLQKIIEDLGYTPSFCTDPSQKETKQYLMPQSFKERGVTAAEVIKKYLASVGGNMHKLPTKEYAKKVSICTRANINQGCTVFYLGKGLYEGYDLSGQVQPSQLNLNAEFSMERELGYNYNDVPLRDDEVYVINNIKSKERKEKLKDVDKAAAFTSQFAPYEKRYSDRLSTSGYVWDTIGPEVTSGRKQNINLYGTRGEGTNPVSFLDGKVVSAGSGRVLIGTNYFLRYCKKADVKVCWNTPIYQESVNLTEVDSKLKKGAEVKVNQSLGKSTKDKPVFVRFFISSSGRSREITIQPSIVWNYAIPVKKMTDEELKNLGIESAAAKPSGSSATPTKTGGEIGRIGSTGRSTGPHLHAEFEPPKPITAADLEGIILIGGKSPKAWQVTGVYNEQRETGLHKGVDLAGAGIENQPIQLLNGTVFTTGREAGFGNYVVIDTPKGRFVLAHLADGSTSGVTGTQVGSRSGSGVQSGPTPVGVEISTEFKGVPRALRIVPGRTVLSFVTKYDEWIEKGRPDSIDPGVWIAGRFSKWFVKDANYRWSQGDLRVTLTGVSDWGNITSRIDVPEFEDYMNAYRDTKEFTETGDYYGYIRSLGDLCWKLKDNKNSCEVICEEAQQFRNFYNPAQGQQGPDVSGNYPNAQCTYNNQVANQIMGMLRSVGINTKVAYSGVIGNAIVESSLNPNVQNTSPGTGCGSTPSRVLGISGYGIFQLCGSRADELNAKYKCGKNCGLQQQLEFAAEEIRTGRNISPKCLSDNWISRINSASSPTAAADIWNECYERGPGGIDKRRLSAEEVFKKLKCQ